MKCVNGHDLSSNGIGCGSCEEKGINFDDRLLFWVDVDKHYGICKHCKRVGKISPCHIVKVVEVEAYARLNL